MLDAAIKIAYEEKMDVVFRTSEGKLLTPELAYSLRYNRGLDVR